MKGFIRWLAVVLVLAALPVAGGAAPPNLQGTWQDEHSSGTGMIAAVLVYPRRPFSDAKVELRIYEQQDSTFVGCVSFDINFIEAPGGIISEPFTYKGSALITGFITNDRQVRFAGQVLPGSEEPLQGANSFIKNVEFTGRLIAEPVSGGRFPRFREAIQGNWLLYGFHEEATGSQGFIGFSGYTHLRKAPPAE
jgi:hypothetical protein